MNSYSTTGLGDILEDMRAEYKAGSLDRLEPSDCISRYSTSIQSNRRHVLLVASDDNFPATSENRYMNNSHVYWASPFYADDATSGEQAANSYNWMCSAMNIDGVCSNNVDIVRGSPDSWRVGYDCNDDFNGINMGNLCNLKTTPVQYCLSQRAQPHCRLQFDTTIAVVVTVLNFCKSSLYHLQCSCIAVQSRIPS